MIADDTFEGWIEADPVTLRMDVMAIYIQERAVDSTRKAQ